jgi:hypothetical protein
MQCHPKLVQACNGLGLNLLEIAKFVQIDTHPAIACWGYDLVKKKHYIFINPKILKLPVDLIRLILKHEILHYAGYRNLQSAKNFQKANIAFDIVINKILTMAQERDMKALCRRIYPPETKHSVLVLARPDVNPDELRNHKKLWHEVWNNPEIPSPASIYYQIVSPRDIMYNPFSVYLIDSSNILFRQIPDKGQDNTLESLSIKVINRTRDLIHNNGFSTAKLNEAFKQIFVNKTSLDSTGIKEFISRIESRQTLESACSRITAALSNQSTCQLYPYQLSRIGVIYVACGVSDRVPIFLNRIPEAHKSRLAIYIDTSPSMECFQEKEVFLIDRLKEYFPTKVYCFAHDVKEISLDDFADGNYEEGYSTSFNAVIEHMIGSRCDAGVIFTDGFSSVNSDNEQAFKQSRKRLFTVYFSDHGEVDSELSQICEKTITINTD